MSKCEYLNEQGDFRLKSACSTNGLYFPLANEAGYMASITPQGGGDAKIDQNHFLMPPVSVVDLHNSRLTRTAWLRFDDGTVWSVTGGAHEQKTGSSESSTVQAGPVWHSIQREKADATLSIEITSFAPIDDVHAEISRLRIHNNSNKPVSLSPTMVVPLYGRSADSLRDHRHVTSLLNVTEVGDAGVYLTPTMSFDERGHMPNTTVYAVLGSNQNNNTPVGCYPDLEAYIGEGGDAERPRVIYDQEYGKQHLLQSGAVVRGTEAVGALQFEQTVIQPNGTHEIFVIAGIFPDQSTAQSAMQSYCGAEQFETALQKNRDFWQEKLNTVACTTGDSQFDSWIRWVSLQPILRRIYGCSFLPYHDYGRGGRGWRDLWQDCLALLLMEPASVRDSLLQNLAGVRFDGTNATIIGSQPGEFIADRNNISRVWMDHGAWPLLTIQLYIDQTGDLAFLFESQHYFSDPQWARAQQKIQQQKSGSTVLHNQKNNVVTGSVLEHMLLQQLSAFFNVGEHNSIRLEGADWNDGLDMAAEKGESVAFTGLYASNLQWLADTVLYAARTTGQPITVAQELLMLLDHYTGSDIDYSNTEAKNTALQGFFNACKNGPSGEVVTLDPERLAADLRRKSESIVAQLRSKEWITSDKGYGWFNGYYDNNARRVEGEFDSGSRMTLTGQVFQILGNVADEQQLNAILAAADANLWDASVGGYRLNTDFNEVKLDLGRCFGFAYGHKENGAMFSHMAVMFANALYVRGKSEAGWRALKAIYSAASHFASSRMYPGIPEYFDPAGRGLYAYLTGSASWYLLTVVTRMFGVRGKFGDLVLDPQLTPEQWGGKQKVAVNTYFRNHPLYVEYRMSSAAAGAAGRITSVAIDGTPVDFTRDGEGVLVPAEDLPRKSCRIVVEITPLEDGAAV